MFLLLDPDMRTRKLLLVVVLASSTSGSACCQLSGVTGPQEGFKKMAPNQYTKGRKAHSFFGVQIIQGATNMKSGTRYPGV